MLNETGEVEEPAVAVEEEPVPGLQDMSLSEIAAVIRHDWGSRADYSARPYITAMFSLDKITDSYGMDNGHSIVAYFLNNASKWRGEKARAVKSRLRQMLKGR